LKNVFNEKKKADKKNCHEFELDHIWYVCVCGSLNSV